jgi:arylsulfatase A-like enzyme
MLKVLQNISIPRKGVSTMLRTLLASVFSLIAVTSTAWTNELAHNAIPSKPNIIFILADDLGYGDLGCYGQKIVQTPHIDEMAAQGMKFTNFYAGATVCAPSRCVLMTGLHNGHAQVRGNGNKVAQSLRDEDLTVAEVLKQAGYENVLIGKWGLGIQNGGDSGLPNRQGFDEFFGYTSQSHAHNPYPEFLWHNDEKVNLGNEVFSMSEDYAGNTGYATKRVQHTQPLFIERTLEFLNRKHEKPFFLYLSLVVPHANNEAGRALGDGQEVDDYGIYADRNWPNPDKGFAATVTLMDKGVGQILDTLAANHLDTNTLVIFTSDNGPHREGKQNPEFFDTNGPLRGMKRDLYEGGIRVPFIARWPNVVPSGVTSEHVSYFGDFFATACELAGVPSPENLDSISIVPTLTGHSDQQKQHEFLYWEFYEQGSKQAVRQGNWKAIRMPMFTGPIELYNLSTDLEESQNVANQNPELVAQLKAAMENAHTANPLWKSRKSK